MLAKTLHRKIGGPGADRQQWLQIFDNPQAEDVGESR